MPKISQNDLTEQFCIGRATVSDILKRRDDYRTQYEENYGCFSSGKYLELKELLFRWLKGARGKNICLQLD